MIYFIHSNIEPMSYVLSGLDQDHPVKQIVLNQHCRLWQRVLRRWGLTRRLPVWMVLGRKLRNFFRTLGDGDSIILADYYHVCVCDAICRCTNSNVHRHLWIWNRLGDNPCFVTAVERLKQMPLRLHTFDPDDASHFNMQLHPQVYSIRKCQCLPQQKTDTDVIFIGYEKGRTKLLNEIAAHLAPFRVNLHIVHDSSEVIPYADYVERIRRSRCLVDVIVGNQKGITLRPLEALTYKKKLITNCVQICDEAFYSSQNIFVIGRDDWSRIDEFLSSPFDESVLSVAGRYDVNAWIESFDEGMS